MKKTVLTALAAVMVASVAVPAIAAQQGKDRHGGPRIERLMERFDANQDGAIMREEISAQHTAMFESVDADNSGSLSKEELSMLSEMRRAEREQARKEMRADREEAREERRAERQGKMGKQAGRGEGMRGQGRHQGRHGGPSMERLDTDNNGEVSAAEFAAMETTMFERFDRNGDNKIDVTDFYRNRTDNN
jgi:Ca2+-binding EF-hand superfamily protein